MSAGSGHHVAAAVAAAAVAQEEHRLQPLQAWQHFHLQAWASSSQCKRVTPLLCPLNLRLPYSHLSKTRHRSTHSVTLHQWNTPVNTTASKPGLSLAHLKRLSCSMRRVWIAELVTKPDGLGIHDPGNILSTGTLRLPLTALSNPLRLLAPKPLGICNFAHNPT